MNSISMKIADTVSQVEYDLLEVPLTETTVLGSTNVETADNNITTYFTANKRIWKHRWVYMTKEEYETLRTIHDRQYVLYKYPLLTIEHLNVENVPVLLTMNERRVVDNCGGVSDIEITMRETIQM